VSAIRTVGLRKTFQGVVALDGLDLAVEAGQVFGFLGPNGAGKTTTLRLLAGLSRPTAGRAWIDGLEVGPSSPARGRVGYLPEEPRFYRWMTASEFLGVYVAGLLGIDRRQGRRRAGELLARVGLEDVARRRIGGFSRGMRQRLGLAQALLHEPAVLLLDEPVSALDPGGRRDMLELIGQLKEHHTVFMSTHILQDVERICDTIGVLNHGKLVTVEGRETLMRRYAIPGIEVEFRAAPSAVAAWAEAVRREPGILAVELHGTHVQLRLEDGPQTADWVQRRFQVARPTLEDVFLRLVGSS
jgi:ABC-2 type transport system ATP-binding protein